MERLGVTSNFSSHLFTKAKIDNMTREEFVKLVKEVSEGSTPDPSVDALKKEIDDIEQLDLYGCY